MNTASTGAIIAGKPNCASHDNLRCFFQTRSGRQRFVYWQTVPLRRLTFLLLAIFCLFGMIAFIIDLLALGRKPLLPVLVWTLFTGGMAVTYLLVVIQNLRYFPIAVAIQLLGSWFLQHLIHLVVPPLSHPSIQSGVRVASIAILGLSMVGCAFFFLFIQGEGRRSVRTETELSLAYGMQQTLVPKIEKQWAGFEIYGTSLPSDMVGGDLVDVVTLRDGSIFAYVADIAGHGLSAGILMGMVKTAIRTHLLDVPSTHAVFDRLNEVLPAVKESHMYATCAALRLFPNDSSTRVECSIAGHPALLHASAATAAVSRIVDEQFPLGLLPEVTYRTCNISVERGDVLLVATDGILEAEDHDGVAFGAERLERLLVEKLSLPLPSLAATLQAAVSRSCRQTDDQTMLLIRFRS